MVLPDFFKAGKKVYVKNPGDAPKGASIQRGPKGGYYYYSTDDPKSPDYEGIPQPKGDYDRLTEESPWKQKPDTQKLLDNREDQIPRMWRVSDNTQIMEEMSELDFPEDYDSWERKEEWEEVHEMLPEYIESEPKETLKKLIDKKLPIYTGKMESNDLNHQPTNYKGERLDPRSEDRIGKWTQNHWTEEWKMGDVSIKVPLRNNYYKQNPPDDMENKLEMCSEALNNTFEDAPLATPFIAFTPKETTYGYTYQDRDGDWHKTTAWGSCASLNYKAVDESPGNFIQIYNNSERNDKSMYHELAHGIAHKIEEPSMVTTTPDAVIDGKTYSQTWNDGWAENKTGSWNNKEIRLVTPKKLNDWNAFMEKWKDKFPETGTLAVGGMTDPSPWFDIKHTCQSVGEIMKEGPYKEFGREHYDVRGNQPWSHNARAPALDVGTKEKFDERGTPDFEYGDYTGEEWAWIEEMYDDLNAMFGKKSDIGKEPEWGWDDDKDGTWNTGNAWEAFTDMMWSRKSNYDKDIFYGKDNSKWNPEELTSAEWWDAYTEHNPGVEDMESVDRPKIPLGDISSDFLPTKDNPTGRLPKSDMHRSVTFDPQEISELNDLKKQVKLQGRYKTGFKTAWKYENLYDVNGVERDYGNQSPEESFADFYGMMMSPMGELKKYHDLGLPMYGKVSSVKKERDEGWEAHIDKIDPEADFSYRERAQARREYKESYDDKIDKALKEDIKTAGHFFPSDHPSMERDPSFAEWSEGMNYYNLINYSKANANKWDWFSRQINRKELIKYDLPTISDKSDAWMYETKEGEKARERKEKAEALKIYRETGELPEGWYFPGADK